MKVNMGSIDRLVRIVISVILVTLIATGFIQGAIATVFSIVAVVFLLTAIAGYCPLYSLIGIGTLRKKLNGKSK